jgi:putative glutamine amidotransferase
MAQGVQSGPLIGITADVASVPQPSVIARRYTCATTYSEAVVAAGGVPLLLCPRRELAGAYVRALDGVLLTGGLDVDPALLPGGPSRGCPLHARAEVMDPQRQLFEQALLAALDERRAVPVLGVCLGMQQMGLHAGAALVQHLGDSIPSAEDHRHDHEHGLVAALDWAESPLGALAVQGVMVASNHHQAIASAGTLRELARSPDGVIEAIDDPRRPFYVGVQWHPERTRQPELGWRVIERLVDAARRSQEHP